MIMIWLIKAMSSVVVSLVAIVLSPVLAAAVRPDGYLPSWLSWFQTPDNPAVGDAAFQITQMSWMRSRYLWALFWLCRNPAYGFDRFAGASINTNFTYACRGDELTGNTPLHDGWAYRSIANSDGTTYWQFYAVWAWSPTRCWKINLGWKLWPTLHAGQKRSIVLTITPFAKHTL